MNRQKQFSMILACLSLFSFVVLTPPARSQQSAEDLYEAALLKKQAQGDLNGAIELFQKIIKAFPEKRDIAAKAQLQVGLCYEKLGRSEAEKAFRKVIDDYPEQSEPVKAAKEKLDLLRAPDGGERGDREFKIRKVWEGPDVDITGSVSPDGQYVSYTDQKSGDLAVRELATGESRRLTTNTDGSGWTGSSIFSPDGRQIAFAWAIWETELRVIGIDGANVRTLARSDTIYPACWTPDGRHILALDSADGQSYQFVLVSVADGTVRPLKTLGPQTPRSWVSYFPDGQNFVYDLPQSDGANDRDIFLSAADGTRETRLIEDPSNDYVLGLTPDGTRLLFSSSRAGSPGLWVARVAGGRLQGRPELVKQDIGSIKSLGISKNMAFFFGNRAQMTQDVCVVGLDPTTQKVAGVPTPLSQPRSVGNSAPDWSPDGKSLAFRSERPPGPTGPGSTVITIRSLDTKEVRDLSPAMKSFFFAKWSPDGRSFLLGGASDKGQFGLHTADARTGGLTATMPNGYWGSWSPDGRSIFYARNDPATKSRPLVVRDLKSGEDRVLVPGFVGMGAAVSPDGSRIAFSSLSGESYGSSTLQVMSLKDSQLHEIFKLNSPEDFGTLTWSPDGARLFFVRRNFKKNKFEVWQIPVQGGEPQAVGASTTAISPISIHPDGKRIAFGVGQNKAEIWVMENFLK